MARFHYIGPVAAAALLLACAPEKIAGRGDLPESPAQAPTVGGESPQARTLPGPDPRIEAPPDAGALPAPVEPLPPRTVDLNTATVEELEALPAIDRELAEAILNYRNRNGRFTQIEELLQVKGMTEEKLELIRPWIDIVVP